MGELRVGDRVCYHWNINRHGTIKRVDTGPKSLYKRIYVQWDDLEAGDLRDYWDHDLQLVQ